MRIILIGWFAHERGMPRHARLNFGYGRKEPCLARRKSLSSKGEEGWRENSVAALNHSMDFCLTVRRLSRALNVLGPLRNSSAGATTPTIPTARPITATTAAPEILVRYAEDTPPSACTRHERRTFGWGSTLGRERHLRVPIKHPTKRGKDDSMIYPRAPRLPRGGDRV